MPFHFYRTLVLIPQASATDWEALQRCLQAIPGASGSGGGEANQLCFGSYCFTFSLEFGTDIVRENNEILAQLGLGKGGFPQRLTYVGDPDEHMIHFNDHVLVMERLEACLPGAILFDPDSGERV